jgi:uncharacterized protein
MAQHPQIQIEVAYGNAVRQRVIGVQVPQGVSIRNAIERSRITEEFPELDLSRLSIGVFGVRCALEDMVRDGDRIEIYAPLIYDPKELRRRRARHT